MQRGAGDPIYGILILRGATPSRRVSGTPREAGRDPKEEGGLIAHVCYASVGSDQKRVLACRRVMQEVFSCYPFGQEQVVVIKLCSIQELPSRRIRVAVARDFR